MSIKTFEQHINEAIGSTNTEADVKVNDFLKREVLPFYQKTKAYYNSLGIGGLDETLTQELFYEICTAMKDALVNSGMVGRYDAI